MRLHNCVNGKQERPIQEERNKPKKIVRTQGEGFEPSRPFGHTVSSGAHLPGSAIPALKELRLVLILIFCYSALKSIFFTLSGKKAVAVIF